MTESLQADFIEEKNKLSSANPLYSLVDIVLPDMTYYINADATEDAIWNGNTYEAYPLKLGVFKTTTGEVPQISAIVTGIESDMIYYIDSVHGGIGSSVTFRYIFYNTLDETTNIPSYSFDVIGCKIDVPDVVFTLGVRYPYNIAIPRNKMLKNFCRYNFPHSVDARCPYTGTTYTSCNRTLSECETRNGTDYIYFGGFPAIGTNEIYQ